MKKRTVFIFFISIQFIFLFSTPLANALNDNIFSETDQPESIAELSSKIKSSSPHISSEYADELAEAVFLIKELEREIFLTNQILELREKREEYGEIPLEIPKVKEFIEGVTEEPSPEEIVVAMQISEEPEESLPREEKSLIIELEKKGKIEKIMPATPPPKVEVYSKEKLEEDRSSVVIESEQTIIVPAIGLKRFMVTDPEMLKSTRIDDNISITGMALGRTFLHIWDSKGRRTIKFTVRQRGYKKFLETKERAIEAAKMESFKTTYSFDRYRLNSKSKNAARSYHYTSWIHRLSTAGGIPWGRVTSRLQYEGQASGGGTELRRDLSAWDVSLAGEDLEISLGNTGAYFSDITLPSTGFQGIRFRNPDEKDINYDFVWGVRGSRMWGYKISGWTNENYFCGARAQVEPADFIYFNTTLLRALEDGSDIGEYIYAGGTGLNFLDDAIKIESEFARGKSEETDVHNHAYKIDTTINLKDYNLLLDCTYRDIDPDFLPVTGSTIPYVGKLGYYFDVDYNPFSYLRLTGEYDVYRSRRSFNPNDTKEYNRDWRGAVNFNIGTDTNFRYAIWRTNHEGQASPSHGRGESYSISHTLSLPPPMRFLSLHFQYNPTQYRNLSSHSGDSREKRYRAGMRLNVLKNLYYDLGHTWRHRRMVESGEGGTLKTLTTGLTYSAQILDTPFYGSLDLRYRKERDVMDNLSLSAGENVVSSEAEIKYRPSGDFEMYLRANYRKIRGVLDHSHNRRETRIYGGGGYRFDTTLRWGAGGCVRGFVFRDFNGNGKKDLHEKGIPGINVYAGEHRSTTSDADGKFEFERLKDEEILVMVDTKMIPEGFKSTTASSQTVKLERELVSEAYFGFMSFAEISGRVFNDVNMNGIFDDGDKGVRSILLKLDDGTIAQTLPSGHYRMEDVKIGARTLTLDTITLPFNLMVLKDTKRAVEIEAGKYYEEDFSLYALRTIVGAVFIDENDNGRFDAEEKGVADVVLRCRDSAAITDSDGRYFLKKLPGGTQEVSLDVESIPPEYELVTEPTRTAELLIEGEIKEDVNFPLRKKEQ